MLGRRNNGSSTSKPGANGAGLAGAGANTVLTGGRQEAAASQFVVQLDEAARERLERMNRRLRLLEQQMEMLEAEVGRASSTADG
ncbi:hypothetical protein D1007_43854 [Hordeum vulgare]|uniref:Predicted protein n=1 Tax=Hordeum vulgare subsp. vulgare TaxID=112509 RepID=F2D0W3_HORVV|nr:uncharacterized protein LOC123444088 [Hordeum vulgare subsp. vulgare]KAE8782758.1 hypothetical protein D1007_43854 [Hordeum vulgare]KAI4999660.1 hypothetical protein ZWY2020_004249 [Hordeum vulgare]BAJ88734.1 predicted protein [Hordeum vulgare subsp. vulgare]